MRLKKFNASFTVFPQAELIIKMVFYANPGLFSARCEGGCTSMRSESKILAGKGRALLVVNPCAGRTKGRLYADLLEKKYGRRQ